MNVFLSYPSEQLSVAQTVHAFLASISINAWFDKISLIAGQDWDFERAEAQERSDVTLLVFSEETGGRAGVIQREIRAALRKQDDQPPGHVHLIVLRTDDVKPAAQLAQLQWVDLFVDGWKLKLARALELRLTQLGEPVPEALGTFLQGAAKSAPVLAHIKAKVGGGEVSASFNRYPSETAYWELVNATIVSEVYGGYFTNLKGIKSWKHGWGESEWTMDVTEVFRSGEILSLSFAYYYYYSGTPHPNHGIITRAFGGSELGILGITDLLESSDQTLKLLQAACQTSLDRDFEQDTGTGFQLDWYVEQFGWDAFADFTFDDRFLTIELTPHGVMPHAFGSHSVSIPWSTFAGRFHEDIHGSEFARTLGLLTAAAEAAPEVPI